MKATITSLGGRAPPGRKTPPLSSGSRWRVSVRSFHAGAVSAPRAHWWSDPGAGRYPARPGAPIGATTPCGSRVSRRPIESPPTATDARACGRRPFGRHAHVPPGNAYWGVPWGPSSLGMSPPINPVRFRERRVSDPRHQPRRRLRFLNLERDRAVAAVLAPARRRRAGEDLHALDIRSPRGVALDVLQH